MDLLQLAEVERIDALAKRGAQLLGFCFFIIATFIASLHLALCGFFSSPYQFLCAVRCHSRLCYTRLMCRCTILQENV